MKKQQNSQKVIPLPLGNKTGEIERDNNDQGLVATLKSTTAGICIPTQLLRRSRRRPKAMEVSRKKCGVHGEKIRVLREKIAAGEYRVEPKAVAGKLLEHVICAVARGILPSYTTSSRQARIWSALLASLSSSQMVAFTEPST